MAIMKYGPLVLIIMVAILIKNLQNTFIILMHCLGFFFSNHALLKQNMAIYFIKRVMGVTELAINHDGFLLLQYFIRRSFS